MRAMRALIVRKLGLPEVLEPGEVPVPEPGPGQVLVRLHATGVNFAERFPVGEAAEAHRLLESRSSVGKIVLLPGAS